MLNIEYDSSEEDISYGTYYCPDCHSEFYGGGQSLHRANCPRKSTGYEGLTYRIGRKAFNAIMDGTDRLNPITIDDLVRCVPEAVKEWRAREGVKK